MALIFFAEALEYNYIQYYCYCNNSDPKLKEQPMANQDLHTHLNLNKEW